MRYPLTIYALEPFIATFEDAIRSEVLAADELSTFELEGDFDFDAKLFDFKVDPTPPTWAELLQEGFPNYEPADSAMSRAVLVIRIVDGDQDRFFAAAFGSGRHLLASGSYQVEFGLKVALNSIYEGDKPSEPVSSNRLRAVQATTVGKNTIRTLKQANRNAAFQDFELDLDSDQLGRVVGTPVDARWGSRIVGSDSVRVQVVKHLGELGLLCRDLIVKYAANDFRTRFDAIDDIRTAPEDRTKGLEARLLEMIQDRSEKVEIAPAELLDWDRVSVLRLSLGNDPEFDDFSVEELYQAIEEDERPLTIDLLKSAELACLDDRGDLITRWTIFECLDAELKVEDKTYILTNGRFYVVSESYLAELDAYLETIERSRASLPASFVWQEKKNGKTKKVQEHEDAYNERAAKKTESALLDKKTVRLEQGGDPIEVCDILTNDRQLIHVKRKFGSSDLSHLFGQGTVSGELFLSSEEFREKTRAHLDTRFHHLVPANRPDPRDFEVSYAIIGPWRGKTPAKRLPFFSKINLRLHTQTLRAFGYRVTYCPIELSEQDGPPPQKRTASPSAEASPSRSSS